MTTNSRPTRATLRGGVFEAVVLDRRLGITTVSFSGPGARQAFSQEGGGHRWQRVPPNEKRGRVHTSTVTVVVLDPHDPSVVALNERDVDIVTTRGSGPGGQNRNKTESCVIATHRASGVQVRIDNERSQHQNKAIALRMLATKLAAVERERCETDRARERKEQAGSGMRGDKVRTYRSQDDQVTDHRTGQKWKLSRWMKGDW